MDHMNNIYVIGDAITDHYYACEHLGKANEASTPLLRQIRAKRSITGGAGFVANSIRQQIKVPASLQSTWSSNWDILRYTIKGETLLTVEAEAPPSMLYMDTRTINHNLMFNNGIGPNSIVVIWDDDKSDGLLLAEAFRCAKKYGATTIVDCSSPDIFDRYPDASIYKLSSSEFSAIRKTDTIDLDKSLLIVTNADGCNYSGAWEGTKGMCGYALVDLVKNPVDTIGAGDVFLARLTYLLFSGFLLLESINDAAKLARESIGYPGCYFPYERKQND